MYPLRYEQDFPYDSTETIIERPAFGCKDDLNDADPTCGWQYDDQSQRIWHSEGFCCACAAVHLLLDSSQFVRGAKCEFLSFDSGTTTAHCLRFQEPYFSAFSIMSPFLEYDMRIGLASATAEDEDYRAEFIQISNAQRIGVSIDSSLKVELVGELMLAQQPESLANKILLVPKESGWASDRGGQDWSIPSTRGARANVVRWDVVQQDWDELCSVQQPSRRQMQTARGDLPRESDCKHL